MASEQDDWLDNSLQYNLTRYQPIDKLLPEVSDTRLNYSLSDNVTDLGYSNFTSDDYCSSNHSHVYLNVTCEFPINYAEPMYGYIAPFLLATTTVANTLIVVVLSRRHMRTPTNVVLMAMALCDMFTMLFPAPWLFYMYTFGNHYKPLSPVRACEAWHYMNEVSYFDLTDWRSGQRPCVLRMWVRYAQLQNVCVKLMIFSVWVFICTLADQCHFVCTKSVITGKLE
ncbi:jg437 [Pararge aegeria aegeria]|uniref:Jg437 protein n=1 Tax=Pararge aegeria aegeria TaxID=348720 RepID=A0A8S4QQJ7_9NEOP|nr:jg437 [Pararge aegeria aegeria]